MEDDLPDINSTPTRREAFAEAVSSQRPIILIAFVLAVLGFIILPITNPGRYQTGAIISFIIAHAVVLSEIAKSYFVLRKSQD